MSEGVHGPSSVVVHEFVQFLAGWVPDEKLAAVRRTLADGQPAAAAVAAVELVTEHEVPLRADSIETARSLVSKPDGLDSIQPVAQDPPLLFQFTAYGPEDSLAADELDGLDEQAEVVAEAARGRSDQVAGVWQTWRLPAEDFGQQDLGRAHRVYLAQVLDASAAPAVAGELQAALDGHGEAGVEVVGLDAMPPPYQAAILDAAELLWSALEEEDPVSEGPPFLIARVFDFATPESGPGFETGHRVVTDPAERDRLLEYLTSGTLVLHTTARTRDVLDPAAGQVVPSSFRTDGEWIWTDAVVYYLRQHGMAPDEELAAYIDARWQEGEFDAETDEATAVEAADFLLHPPAGHAREAAWTPGAND